MKIKTNYANEPVWLETNIHPKVPQELKILEEIAHNLWWVWNYEAKELFSAIDKDLWSKTEGNPVLLLYQLSQSRLQEITEDETLMNSIRQVYEKFSTYMKEPVRTDVPSVAYFSMEYGLTNILKIYSGGLGVLAGDYIKEASDINVNLTAIGLLYRHGYFTQTLSMDGQQIANYEPQNFDRLPIKQLMDSNLRPVILEVPYNNFIIYANVWYVNVGRDRIIVPSRIFHTDLINGWSTNCQL